MSPIVECDFKCLHLVGIQSADVAFFVLQAQHSGSLCLGQLFHYQGGWRLHYLKRMCGCFSFEWDADV
ncbi:MAG: hypothetical protein RBJ76_05905 [Stenomitos frigidus ULC029]